MANSVGPIHIGAVLSWSMLFASIRNLSIMLGTGLQQTTSADKIFRCIFFLGALRVRPLLLQELEKCSIETLLKYVFDLINEVKLCT